VPRRVGVEFVICDACGAMGTKVPQRLRGFRWCGGAECGVQLLEWAEDDFDADELGLDPEEDFDA